MSLAILRSRRGIVAAYLWWAVALPTVIISLSLPLWPEWLRRDWFWGYGELMFLGLAAVGAFWRAQFLRHALLKRWWRIFGLALSVWYLGALLSHHGVVGDGPLWSVLATDISFSLYYLIVVIMLDQMVGRPNRVTASVALVTAMFGYVILLPALYAPDEYQSWIPSYLFYVSLDLYIFARISLILRSVWHTRIGLDAAALWLIFAGFLVSDVLDGLWNIAVLDIRSSDELAVIFYLPLLPLLLIPSPLWRWAWRRPKWQPKRLPTPDLGRLVLWLMPLAVHLIGYGFALFETSLRAQRDGYLTVWLLVVVLFEAYRRWRLRDFDEPASPSKGRELEQVAEVPVPTDPLLEKLDQFLGRHIADQSLSLETLGAELALSPRQIQRRLKAATGLSPSQYLLEKRLARAAELLMDGNKSTYVAHATGFSQQSHFTRRFKERYGVTPGQYANQREAVDGTAPISH